MSIIFKNTNYSFVDNRITLTAHVKQFIVPFISEMIMVVGNDENETFSYSKFYYSKKRQKTALFN